VGLVLVAIAKLMKAALLAAVAAVALNLVHGRTSEAIREWARALVAGPHTHFHRIGQLIEQAVGMEPGRLRAIAIGAGAYAMLFAVEGAGLLMAMRWAEWITVVTTSLLIPIELWEIFKRPTATKALALVANIAIVVYLIRVVRRPRGKPASPSES
jgi:uncharacterized membrane protein (DUF2068 family)